MITATLRFHGIDKNFDCYLEDGKAWFPAIAMSHHLGFNSLDVALALCSNHQVQSIEGTSHLSVGGVCRLLMRSQHPDGLKFQEWISDEVAPSIIVEGLYSIPELMESQGSRVAAIANKRREEIRNGQYWEKYSV